MGLEYGAGTWDWNMGLHGLVDWNVRLKCIGLEHHKQKLLTYTVQKKKKDYFNIASYPSCSLNSLLHVKLCTISPIINFSTKKINHTCIYPRWETMIIIMFGSIRNNDD